MARKSKAQARRRYIAECAPENANSESEKLVRWIGVVDAQIDRLEKHLLKFTRDADAEAAERDELDGLRAKRRGLVRDLVKLGAEPKLVDHVLDHTMPIGRDAKFLAKYREDKPKRVRAHLRSVFPAQSAPGGLTVGPDLLRQIDDVDAKIEALSKGLLRLDRDPDTQEAATAARDILRRKRKALVRQAVNLGAGIIDPGEVKSSDPAWWPGDDENDDDPLAKFEGQARSALSELLAAAGVERDDNVSAQQVVEIAALPMALGMERRASEQALLDRLTALEAAITSRLDDIERSGIKFQGTYQRAVEYERGSVVVADGSSWVATRAVAPGEAPPKPGEKLKSTPWALMAKAGRNARDAKDAREDWTARS